MSSEERKGKEVGYNFERMMPACYNINQLQSNGSKTTSQINLNLDLSLQAWVDTPRNAI